MEELVLRVEVHVARRAHETAAASVHQLADQAAGHATRADGGAHARRRQTLLLRLLLLQRRRMLLLRPAACKTVAGRGGSASAHWSRGGVGGGAYEQAALEQVELGQHTVQRRLPDWSAAVAQGKQHHTLHLHAEDLPLLGLVPPQATATGSVGRGRHEPASVLCLLQELRDGVQVALPHIHARIGDIAGAYAHQGAQRHGQQVARHQPQVAQQRLQRQRGGVQVLLDDQLPNERHDAFVVRSVGLQQQAQALDRLDLSQHARRPGMQTDSWRLLTL
mmetsp:Transcript_2546/g.9191  ORF Transcript_2546/g.9191 Transcript_2546/m.9191 type:complete len:277 (+) Transcript_2546:2866-3696(+)